MINLDKKKPINLAKQASGLDKVKVGLSWDPTSDGKKPDADASVFLLDETGKIPEESYLVFYNNKQSGDGSVLHSGDNRDGAGSGDDEQIDIDLSKVSPKVVQLILVITIHNIDAGFHFGNILNSSVRVYDTVNSSTICQYKLDEVFPECDSLILGRFFRNGTGWEFEAIAQAFSGGLGATLELYS